MVSPAKIIIDSVFPRRCPVCGDIAMPKGKLICPDCEKSIRFIKEPVCKKCGREIAEEDGDICGNCSRHHFSFRYGIALMEYTDLTARIMGDIKYKSKKEYLDYFATSVSERLGADIKRMHVDAVAAVPVHRKRLIQRGYNQALVLAQGISEKLQIPVMEYAIVRDRNTKALKKQNAGERLKTLMNAMSPGDIPDSVHSVLLVDDIFTTGATMEACTRVLRSAGVEHVYCLSLCIRSEV